MSNLLDDAAEKIASLIVGNGQSEPEPTEELKPLPPSNENSDDLAVALGRGSGDLQRFVLPSIQQPYGAGPPVEGSSNLALRYLPREAQFALKVVFPDPVYGIWLDPFWTSPGAQIGIAYSGASRANFFALTRGKGVRFKTPVREIRILNLDGMEQVATPAASWTMWPYGYLSFLVALSPEATYLGEISSGAANVSSEIQNFTYSFAVPTITPNLGNVFTVGTFGSEALSEVDLYVQPLNINNGAAASPVSLILMPWHLTAYPFPDLTVVPRSIDVFNVSKGNFWTRGHSITMSNIVDIYSGIPPLSIGTAMRRRYRIPPGTIATVFTFWQSFVVPGGNATSFVCRVMAR